MSYDIGIAALHLQPAPRVARSDFVFNWDIVRRYTGKDPQTDPRALKEFYDLVDLDLLWETNDGPLHWRERGRITDMGHATWVEDGSDFHPPQPCPFKTAEDVLAFDAVAEYGRPDFDGLVAYYENWYQEKQAFYDRQVVTGGYYNTLISGAIQAFGWEMLLEAVGEDPARFGEKVLGSIFELSLHHCRAWAKTSIEVFNCHDDIVWTAGPFLRPDFYREYIFPRYKELWRPLLEAGKRVLYTSDGTFEIFMEDIAAAGAQGFAFEPTNNLARVVEKFGYTHVLIGGMDCRTLTFGGKDDIENEMRRVLESAGRCPGFIFCVGNQIPANVPTENAIHYFNLIERLGRR